MLTMRNRDIHLSDQDLICAADGELSARRAAQVRAHLSACWSCRARLQATEKSMADFAGAYRASLDPQLPPAAGPHALLRAQLAQRAATPERSPTPLAAIFAVL